MMKLVRNSLVGLALFAASLAAPAASAQDKPAAGPAAGAVGRGGEARKLLAPPKLVTAPAAARRKLELPLEVADAVGHQIWLNETGGNADEIVAWNNGEDFMSLGIGHFLWFPAGVPAPFEESFPRLIEFYRRHKVALPDWLDKTPVPPCPWRTRADFVAARSSPQVVKLRKLLHDTKGVQIQFLLERARGALDAILANTPDESQRRHIELQFSRVITASRDLYPLIDYINFKGEGINPDETSFDAVTGRNEGWGLRHVLLAMSGTSDDPAAVLGEFADGAKLVLLRRIRNNPPSKRWQEGWLKRVATYRKPLVRVPSAGKTPAPVKASVPGSAPGSGTIPGKAVLPP